MVALPGSPTTPTVIDMAGPGHPVTLGAERGTGGLRGRKEVCWGEAFEWELEGLCRTTPDAFFPKHANESPGDAKAVCDRCPVEEKCLENALENREPHGIWGGKTTRERRRILRDRGDSPAA